MLKAQTKAEIDQLAIDRTPTYQSANVGISKPINEHLQVNLDGTAATSSGTISSGGVDGTLSPGTDYYVSGQLVGTDVLQSGDMLIGGLRFANQTGTNLYVADISGRYPLTPDLRVTPRVTVSYLEGTNAFLREYQVLPSVLFNYIWNRDTNFELETGARWTQRDQAGTRETSTDLFVTVGVRYDFNADGSSKCPYPTFSCK